MLDEFYRSFEILMNFWQKLFLAGLAPIQSHGEKRYWRGVTWKLQKRKKVKLRFCFFPLFFLIFRDVTFFNLAGCNEVVSCNFVSFSCLRLRAQNKSLQKSVRKANKMNRLKWPFSTIRSRKPAVGSVRSLGFPEIRGPEEEFQSGSILRVEKSGQLAPPFSSPGATHPQRGWELPGMFWGGFVGLYFCMKKSMNIDEHRCDDSNDSTTISTPKGVKLSNPTFQVQTGLSSFKHWKSQLWKGKRCVFS